MRIVDKLISSIGLPHFSLEFFPPRNDVGIASLLERIERMSTLQPLFVDFTFESGGCTKETTLFLAEYTQKYYGVDVLLHITCTNLKKTEIKTILDQAKTVGIQNILALRGDPLRNFDMWTPVPDGFQNACELVEFIKLHYGDYFCIGVAGFPEGHPTNIPHIADSSQIELDKDIIYLKKKIDAGAEFIIAQFFYDTSAFQRYVSKCRAVGIKVPIFPGIMPIYSYNSLIKLTNKCGVKLPQIVSDTINICKDNEDDVKAYGVQLLTSICKDLINQGVPNLHFHTLNLENTTLVLLSRLGMGEKASARRRVPWRGARGGEGTRPIHWAHRYKSYIDQTAAAVVAAVAVKVLPSFQSWDACAFRSELLSVQGVKSTTLHRGRTRTWKEDRLAMWGDELTTPRDVHEVFIRYLRGEIPVLPWCDLPMQVETTSLLQQQLLRLNQAGYLTINSQPAINGESSEHIIYGWGGPGGKVFQKAYVEFFISAQALEQLLQTLNQHPNLTFHAINAAGVQKCSDINTSKSIVDLSWGIFNNTKQVVTVFDLEVFSLWSKECFDLWLTEWAALYDDSTDTSGLLYQIHDNYFLVSIFEDDVSSSGELFTILNEASSINC